MCVRCVGCGAIPRRGGWRDTPLFANPTSDKVVTKNKRLKSFFLWLKEVSSAATTSSQADKVCRYIHNNIYMNTYLQRDKYIRYIWLNIRAINNACHSFACIIIFAFFNLSKICRTFFSPSESSINILMFFFFFYLQSLLVSLVFRLSQQLNFASQHNLWSKWNIKYRIAWGS